MKLNMDLAREFKKILEDFGHDVLVIKQDKKLYCSCYNEVTQEASRDCPLCLGLGWTFTAERHTTRSEDATGATQLIKLMKNSHIGNVVSGDRKYFFLPNMNAIEKDLIVEVEWDKFGKPTYKDGGIWSVTTIDKNLNLGAGKDVYKVYYASETPVRSKIRGIRISEINGIKQYNILLEG